MTLFNVFPPKALDIEPGGGKETAVGKFVNRDWVKYIIAIAWFFLVVYSITSSNDPHRWISATYTFVLPLSVVLASKNFLLEIFSEYKIRHFVIICLLYLPCICFAKAKEEAENISHSIEFKYITRKVEIDEKFKVDTLKYLAMANDKMVFTDRTNKNIIFIKLGDTIDLKYKNNTPPYRGFITGIKSLFGK